jgi:hypothetical protein
MSLNHDSTIHSRFQFNISHIGPHLLKWSLNPHVKGSVKVLIKLLNLPLPINLSF